MITTEEQERAIAKTKADIAAALTVADAIEGKDGNMSVRAIHLRETAAELGRGLIAFSMPHYPVRNR